LRKDPQLNPGFREQVGIDSTPFGSGSLEWNIGLDARPIPRLRAVAF